jgi:hypothetical protein
MDWIASALIAALGQFSEPAIKDAYEALKALIVKKFGSHHEIVQAVENLEKKPDSAGRKESLREEVAASKAGEDADILSAAKSLLESIKKLPGGQQTIEQIVTGNRNIFSGTGDVHVSDKGP